MQDQLQHPSADELAAFSSGLVDEEQLTRIQGHIAQCPSCRAVLKSLLPDKLVTLLRESIAHEEDFDIQDTLPYLADLPPALAIHPRYRILAKIGSGGMGTVYKAEHRLMKRVVALKVINHKLIARSDAIARFRRELEAVAKLAHPNIAAAHDAEQAGDTHFLVLEFVEGSDLAKLVKEKGRLPVAETCDYIRQAAIGLQHAHERGMVHRDIKPQNLMLTPDGTIKILDFGLATFLDEMDPDDSGQSTETPMPGDSLTDFGEGMGTPDYASPEQIRDAHSIDARADIYSLGCTLYFLLAGHAPFSSAGRTQKVVGHLERQPLPLGDIRKDVPKELLTILDRMLAKHPSERFQTAAEAARALVPFSGGKRHLPWNSRWQRRSVLAALFGLFAILAGLGIHKMMVQKEVATPSGPTGCILFNRPTDTIRIDGGTILENECTFEARVLFTDLYSYPGTVFDEWTDGKEDKYLAVAPASSIGAMSYPVCHIAASVPMKENIWHHVAYVYDGKEGRFYLDGRLVASKPASGKIGNGAGQLFIGAIPRPPGENPRRSFLGYLDTLRISNVARYTGERFVAPDGDLANDDHTVLLFNFNEPAGSKTLIDESAHGLTGSLGVGFEAATSPQLVPDPLTASQRNGQ